MKKMILVFLVSMLLISGCTFKKSPPFEDPKMTYCETDDDCTLVSISSCCGFVAVNKEYKNKVKSVPMVCEMYCPKEARCEKNECTLFDIGIES
ncbi:MAG: hypothetical protein NDI94_05890 [Candidatus Woesearchaeota archaeon]|nr:hypothetical protein [Candidatus Woesearchaeota archaeon]